MMKKFTRIVFHVSLLILFSSQSIADKKEMTKKSQGASDQEFSFMLKEVNQELAENRELLNELYEQAEELFEHDASPEMFSTLLVKVKQVRTAIRSLEQDWQENISEKSKQEQYSLWNQSEISLSQLVMDYGSNDYVYLIDPELAQTKISINSNLPIPRESWEKMLLNILEANGVGTKQINPFLRMLYPLKDDASVVKSITNRKEDLSFYSESNKICYILSPKTLESKETLHLLSRFANPKSVTLIPSGKDILIIAKPKEVLELSKVFDFIETHHKEKEYRILTLNKVNAEEMEKVLFSVFQGGEENKDGFERGTSLRTLPLKSNSRSLFLTGNKEEVEKAAQIIQNLEEQMASAREMTLFWYTCKNTSAEDLAKVLSKVYPLLSHQDKNEFSTDLSNIYFNNNSSMELGEDKIASNFIADPKTGSILMVVESDLLDKMKDVLRKLDVPKRMVHIEVMLIEKKIKNSNHLGINFLKMGKNASNAHSSGLSFTSSTGTESSSSGILDFLLSRKKSSTGIPAYDLAYQFLLSHEDIQINASPSVTTVNQTPAKIEILEEISINNGTVVKGDNSNTQLFTDAFSRNDYGIIIEITPNVHMSNDDLNEDETNYITLNTDIQFDTTGTRLNAQPDVTKRHITNEVRIADGQTVIIGGLRRKDLNDSKEKIPFLGELPGFGKLFGSTQLSDNSTEMFVFLTPKIITDPKEDFEKIQKEALKRRPGDTTEFIQHLEQAKKRERERLFDGTLTMLFGRPSPEVEQQREYDGS